MDNIVKRIFRPMIIKYGRKIEEQKFSRPPIFIVACPRSGTTMLLSILSAHPHIFTINRQTYAFDKWAENSPVPIRLDRLYRELIVNKIKKSAVRWCEKTPKHLESSDKIMEFLPDAKIVCLVRDGRDVATSKHPKHNSNDNKYWVSPSRWAKYAEMAISLAGSENFKIIRYEDIIHDFEKSMKQVLEFIGEDYTEEMDKWFENKTFSRSKHLEGRVKELHSNSIGRWQKNEHRERTRLFMENPKAVEYLRKLGYSIENNDNKS